MEYIKTNYQEDMKYNLANFIGLGISNCSASAVKLHIRFATDSSQPLCHPKLHSKHSASFLIQKHIQRA